MRLNLILLALMVVLGLGISFLLVPREKDVALLKLRSDASDEARQVLLDQYDRGDRSVAVIASLAEIAIGDGEIPTAVELLEAYVQKNPKDIGARRRLAEYYRFDQRRGDYVDMLADVVGRDGTPQERRQLVNLYRLRGEYDLLLSALKDLIDRGLAQRPDFAEAASLSASAGRLDQSLALTEAMWRALPASFDARSIRLYVMVAEAAGVPDKAVEAVGRLAAGEGGPAAIVPVIQEVSDRDQAAFGLRLLRQFEETLHLTPQLLVSWARMQMSLDKDAVALERLTKLEEAGDLPDLAVPVLLDLALAKGDIDLIATVLEDRSVAKMTDVRVRAIADLAVFERRSDLLQQILDQTLPSFRDNEPALMAEILIALGELDEGLFRVQHARRQEIPRLDQLIRLARAEIRLGLDNDAAVTLRRIARAADLDETSMRALAQLYIDTERTRQGLEDFERIRTERPSFAASAGWARLAVREGLDSEVLAWMNEREGLGEDLLSDIAVLGLPDRAPASALEAARRLARDHPSRESDRLLAEALIANGRAGEALTIVEALLPGDSEEASTYVTALNALGRDQAALEFLLQRQAERPLEPALVDELVALAFQLERKDIAYAVADRGDLRKIEETALVELVTNAAEDKRLEIVDRIVAQTGPAFLQARPVLAGEVELARGNPVDARLWAYEAAGRPDLGLAEKLGLARLWDRLGEQGNALQLLRSMARDDQTPAFALADLGAAYLRLGREAEGLAVFRELKERRADAPVMENWARLETAAGDPAQALAWLEGASGVSPQALTDIHYIALERPAPELSLLAARRLAAVQPGPSSDRILANALLAQGLAAEALPLIEPLLPGDDDLTEAYVGALTALRRNAEAFAWLEKRRSEGALPLRLADDYISLALDQGRSQLAYAEAGRHALSELPDEVLIALAQSAANDRAFQLFDRIVAELGDEFLADRPVLAASLALAREQEASARDWADKAFAREGRTNSESIQLANVFLALGNPERALGLLSGVARDPETPDTALVDLANAYLTLGRAKEGLPVFRSLIETRTAPGVLEGWARLETAEGQSDRVRDWLKSADNVSAQALADIHYIAAERRADNLAFEAGERYYQTYPGPESRRIYGTTLVARGRAEDAIPVLEELLPGDDELAEAYAGALSAVNRKAEALAFLSRRSEGGRLPVRIADDYMALAIELDQPKLAYAEARRHDLSKFDGDTIASLAENAAEDNDLELIDQIVGQTEAVFWEARPVMAARIELARGNEAAARGWAEKALAAGNLENADSLRLARVFNDLGETERSLALLERLAGDPETPAFAMADLANQYLRLGKAEQGLPVLRRLIERRGEPQIAEGWARLETKAGDPARVQRWLKDAAEPGRQALTDIYYLAAERNATDLALDTSARLFERFPGQEARLIRGQALVAAGRGKEAVAILQPLLPGTPEVRSAYVAALGQGGETRDLKAFAEQVLDDPDLEPEIRSALLFALLENGAADMALPRLRELARRDPKTWELAYFDALRRAGTIEERVGVLTARLDANPAPAARDQLLFELLEAGGPAAALPYLKRAAEGDPDGTWPASYEAALAELGRTEELVAWLTTRAKLPGTPERVRRELAFRLLDLNALRQAEAVFLDLATGAPTTSPDVQQLLYLWGPKPPERGIEWLVARTRGAEAEDRGRWLGLLANMRAWDQIVALGSRPGPASAKDPALAPLINALIATRRRAEVSAVLDPLIAKTDDPKDLLQMADWAEQAERSDTSVAAYQRAMTRIGDDPEALLRAGRAFTFAGRAELAKETLERYFRAPGNKGDTDHRPWYYYGQSLSQMNRQPEAREAYRRMLSNMQQNGASDFDSRRMAATGHEALGDGERAVEIYEGLLAERPRDRSLVADFAALLIELRQFERAETLLSQN